MNGPEKGEGFPGQRILMLPRRVVAQALKHPLLGGLLPTDVGYFPKAAGHRRERPAGAEQAILIYCVQGCGWCELAGQNHAIKAGELLAIPPRTPHAYGADERHPWTTAWVHADGAHVAAYLGELGASVERPVLWLGEDAQLLALFEEINDALEQGYAPSHLLHGAVTLAHLLGVMVWRRQHQWHGEPGPSNKIAQSISHMKQHLAKPLHVPTLAALANLSVSHYTALFKRQTGYAPIDYLIRLRLHQACQLLDTTALSVKAIAAAVGYDDPLYFSRLFKAVNETSPTEYRALSKG